jgi:hypothetical protein
MVTFQDGPAIGQKLMLRRAPKYLRVVEENGKFDALDQPSDTPRETETLYAYQLVGEPGMMHLNGGKGRHGFFAIANYQLVKKQPTDEQMRNLKAWLVWIRGNE